MAVERAQISEHGRVVIPAAFRKAMGLKGGETVTFRLDEHGLHMQSRAQAIRRAQEIVSKCVPAGVSLVDDLAEERRREAKREEDSL